VEIGELLGLVAKKELLLVVEVCGEGFVSAGPGQGAGHWR